MHVRDRLRAALAQKRALEFCWSCAIVRSHQVRWLQTSAASAGLRPERLPTESDPPLAFDFRETKVNSFKIKEIPLHPILESTPRQSRVYREGHHDTTETQKNSNGVESVAERRERLRFIIPGLRTFKNESVEVRKVRGGRTFKNESVEARKVRGGIFRKTWIKSPRAWTAGKSEVLRGDIMDLLATSMGIPARRKSRPSSRTGAATRTSHGIDRLHANSISSAADVAATELDADTKLEGPMLDHLVDPLTPDPSEGMTAQRAAISSRPINNLVSFHPLWTPSGPMSSSNTSRLRYEDGFQASPILGTRSNSTVVCMQPYRYGAASDSSGRGLRVHPIPIPYLHQISKSLRSYPVSETLAFEST